jgi:hypothetical protein
MKAKTHPAVLAALLAVAVVVAGESAVAVRHVERAGTAWLTRAQECAARDVTLTMVRCATQAVVRWAKS